MSDAPSPLEVYYASEYHRRNMQVARVCGAQASVDQALERALAVKSIPLWLIAYLESAANRLPGLQTDLAAWRDLSPDAPETVRTKMCANAQSRVDQESPDPLALAKLFHDTYERLAPQYGYQTRLETRKFAPDTPNGKLMVATCAEILAAMKGGGA